MALSFFFPPIVQLHATVENNNIDDIYSSDQSVNQ